MANYEYHVLIPARGGSKGIKNKNIKSIAGQPLINWTIQEALRSKKVSKVVVSTDSEEIKSIAINAGAEVPFLRPSQFAQDQTSTEAVITHYYTHLRENGHSAPDAIVLLQCTSPIREKNSIDRYLDEFETGNFDSMLTVAKSHRFHWKNKDQPTATYDVQNRPRRQDIQEIDQAYVETGATYIFKSTGFLKEENRLFGKIGLLISDEKESYEIDDDLDFMICEAILELEKKCT